MHGDRLRTKLDAPYEAALGRVLFVFANLEWNAVWCCERIVPGFIHTVGRLTSGQIAQKFFNTALRMPPSSHRADCCDAAAEFRVLVDKRNDLVHAKPCTVPGGAQRLTRDGFLWSLDAVERAADDFAECSMRLNALLHGPLCPPE